MSEKPEGMLIQTMSQMFGGIPMLVPVIKVRGGYERSEANGSQRQYI